MRAKAGVKFRPGWRGLIGFIFLVVLLALLLTPTRWGGLPQRAERFLEIGRAMFQTYLLPFEVLSVLLLVALIGAVYMAKREELGAPTPQPGEGEGGTQARTRAQEQVQEQGRGQGRESSPGSGSDRGEVGEG